MKGSEANLQFGRNLTALRKKAGYTRKQLADILNVTEMSVGTYERGIRTPSLEKILQLADLFKVSTDDLLRNKTAENISDNLIRCMFSVGDRREEFNIPAENEKRFMQSLSIATKLIKLIDTETREMSEKNLPVNLSFTLTQNKIENNELEE